MYVFLTLFCATCVVFVRQENLIWTKCCNSCDKRSRLRYCCSILIGSTVLEFSIVLLCETRSLKLLDRSKVNVCLHSLFSTNIITANQHLLEEKNHSFDNICFCDTPTQLGSFSQLKLPDMSRKDKNNLLYLSLLSGYSSGQGISLHIYIL